MFTDSDNQLSLPDSTSVSDSYSIIIKNNLLRNKETTCICFIGTLHEFFLMIVIRQFRSRALDACPDLLFVKTVTCIILFHSSALSVQIYISMDRIDLAK